MIGAAWAHTKLRDPKNVAINAIIFVLCALGARASFATARSNIAEPYRYAAELSVGCEEGGTHIDPCAQDVRVVEVERWRAERPGGTPNVDQRSDSHDR